MGGMAAKGPWGWRMALQGPWGGRKAPKGETPTPLVPAFTPKAPMPITSVPPNPSVPSGFQWVMRGGDRGGGSLCAQHSVSRPTRLKRLIR